MLAKVQIARRHCYLLLAAALMTYLLITMGGIVCATESGAGCPDWPGCFGRILPPPQLNAVIEYLHRFIAALTSPLIIAAAIVGWQRARPVRWVSRPPLLALPFLIAVIIFGALAVLRGLARGWAAVDLGAALIVLGLMITATVAAFARRADPEMPDRLSVRSPFARLTSGALVAVYAVLVSSVLVAGKGSITRCLGWPVWQILEPDLPGWPQVARLVVAVAASLLIIAVVVQAWRAQRGQPGVVSVATVLGVVYLAEMLIGALALAGGLTAWLQVLYVALAGGTYALLIVLAAMAGLRDTAPERHGMPQAEMLPI
jgi:heme a synthase